MNTLLLYPDKPFGLGDLTAFGYNPETQERERIRKRLVNRSSDEPGRCCMVVS